MTKLETLPPSCSSQLSFTRQSWWYKYPVDTTLVQPRKKKSQRPTGIKREKRGKVMLVLALPRSLYSYWNYTANWPLGCIPEVCGLTMGTVSPLFWAGGFYRFPPLLRTWHSREHIWERLESLGQRIQADRHSLKCKERHDQVSPFRMGLFLEQN